MDNHGREDRRQAAKPICELTRRLHAMSEPKATGYDAVEITPEMIEAGSGALYSLDDDLMGSVPIQTASRLAAGVFEAMVCQSRQLSGGKSTSCNAPTGAGRHEEPAVSDVC